MFLFYTEKANYAKPHTAGQGKSTGNKHTAEQSKQAEKAGEIQNIHTCHLFIHLFIFAVQGVMQNACKDTSTKDLGTPTTSH